MKTTLEKPRQLWRGLAFGNVKAKITLLLIVAVGGWFISAHARGTNANQKLSLEWQISRYYNDGANGNRTAAKFTLTNLGNTPLPATGWTIYFNAIAGAETAAQSNSPIVEHVAGTLFRIRPNANGHPLNRGDHLTLNLEHPGIVTRIQKAPIGPYLVFNNDPSKAFTLTSFRPISPPKRANVENSNQEIVSEVTPQEIFDYNASINNLGVDELPPIFPSPAKFSYGADVLRLSQIPNIDASPQLTAEKGFADRIFTDLRIARRGRNQTSLKLLISPLESNPSQEAYKIEISKSLGIQISANSPSGIYYGLVSLKQILSNSERQGGNIAVREMTIEDTPRFEFRGLLIDVARNFQSKEKLKSIIDLMARYKLNKLHLHLTDDEGWRLQIDQIPELTSYGANRGHSVDWQDLLPPAYGSGPNVSDPHGSGFYTGDDYVEILQYAAARHIEVIPEIEMPGHQRSAVKAMEARYRNLKAQNHPDAGDYLLSDLEDQSNYRSAQLYTDNVINPALPSTYAFVEVVVTQIAELHRRAGVPLKTLHMGADELATGAWENSPKAHAMMRREGIANTADLWNYYYDRVETILAQHNIKMAGWEELGLRKEKVGNDWKIDINPHFVGHDFTLFVWNNLEGSEDLGYRLANAGYKVVLAPVTNFYFDMAHNRDVSEPGHDWANFTELRDVFAFNPYKMAGPNLTQLSPQGRANINGIEATMFSETMRDPSRVNYMLMPRLLGLAERAWAKPPLWESENSTVSDFAAGYTIFANQLSKQILPQLDKDMPNLAYRIAPPGAKVIEGQVHANHQLPGTTLRYSIGNTSPNRNSPIYSRPIVTKGKINIAAFSTSGRSSRTSTVNN